MRFLRFRVDGREFLPGAGGGVAVRQGRVDRFLEEGGGRPVMRREVRPPGLHREMLEPWNRPDRAGKTSRNGVPIDPLAPGLLWEPQDGCVAGLPVLLQRLVFGGLDRLVRRLG